MTIFGYDFIYMFPELFLVLLVLIVFCFGIFGTFRKSKVLGQPRLLIPATSMFVFGLMFLIPLLYTQASGPVFLVAGLFYHSKFTIFAKFMIVLATVFYLILTMSAQLREGLKGFEFPFLVSLATLASFVMVSANDFIIFYLALELQSFVLYVMAAIRRGSPTSAEAALKYFLLGSLSSALLLFGISMIYGFTGFSTFYDLKLFFSLVEPSLSSISLLGGLLLFLVGLLFKVARVPFHIWAPDVYDGSPFFVTFYFATVAKIAPFLFLFRFTTMVVGHWSFYFQSVFLFCGFLSIFLGVLGAFYQDRLKRFMAYTGIAHTGFMLLPLSIVSISSYEAFLFYLTGYLVLGMLFFGALSSSYRYRNGEELFYITDLRLITSSNPMRAFVLSSTLFSMAGLPPLLGFFMKFFVLVSLAQAGQYALVFLVLLFSAIASYYYLKAVRFLYFDNLPYGDSLRSPTSAASYFLIFLTIFNLTIFLYSDLVLFPLRSIVLTLIFLMH